MSAETVVTYRSVYGDRRKLAVTILVAVVNVAIELSLLVWLLLPNHWPAFSHGARAAILSGIIVSTIALMEIMRVVSATSLSIATATACDPIPMQAQPGLRVAMITTIVPSKEPIEIVTRTLEAARKVRYRSGIDVWLLDEGDDDTVRATCSRLGVRHFTRKGVDRWNQPRRGAFEAKTKHGNINSWIDAHGDDYDIILCVDPDHVPKRHFAEKVLGYFQDPDVAFVVAPQFYANDHTLVTRGAESQQFPFHSIIQRAANRFNVPMLVGTNNAIRMTALRQVGGYAASITEDLATGIAMHRSKNPVTGRKWKSVYVKDVLALGEGPESWSDFFSQQLRWSRGSYQVLGREFLPRGWKLGPRRIGYYGLILSFYPSMALGWLLGAINTFAFLGFAPIGLDAPVKVWTVLLLNATLFQLWIYMRSRDLNVSPLEDTESPGLLGAFMSIVTLPMYTTALLNALMMRPGKFVVTPKGAASNTDTLWAFRMHLAWAGAFVASVIVGVTLHNPPVWALVWPITGAMLSLCPVAMWRVSVIRRRRAERARGRTAAIHPLASAHTARLVVATGEAS